ncbi:secretion system effector C (SseC) like family protein, partial [Vibrio parahaemolyticus V-223/04]
PSWLPLALARQLARL